MSGAKLLLALYSFMAWKGNTSSFYLYLYLWISELIFFSCLDQFCRNPISELPGYVHHSTAFLSYKRPDPDTHMRQYC